METMKTGWIFCCWNFWSLMKVLTEILFALRQKYLCPSSFSPFWSSSLTISLFLACYFVHSPFPSPAFPNALIFLELTFLRGSSRQQLTPCLSHVFCFSWSFSHLSSSSTSCVWSVLVGHCHQAGPIYLFRTTFAVMAWLQDLQRHKYGETIWAANPITAWHCIHDLT